MTAAQARKRMEEVAKKKEMQLLMAEKEKNRLETLSAKRYRKKNLAEALEEIKTQIENGWGYYRLGKSCPSVDLLKEDLEKLGYTVELDEFKGSDESDTEMVYYAKW